MGRKKKKAKPQADEGITWELMAEAAEHRYFPVTHYWSRVAYDDMMPISHEPCPVCNRPVSITTNRFVPTMPMFILTRRDLHDRPAPMRGVSDECMRFHPLVEKFVWVQNKFFGYVPVGEWAVADNQDFMCRKEPWF